MTDFVLVHGAWHGAWCWQKILPSLWAKGHRAFAVTLTGVGEREHLDVLDHQAPVTSTTSRPSSRRKSWSASSSWATAMPGC